MRTIVCAGACFLVLFAAGCGDDGGGTTSAGTGGSGGTGGTATTGGAGGSGGTGGSAATGGTGGQATTTTGTTTTTGGTGGTGGSAGAAFGEACTIDTDCVDGLVCFEFNSKGTLCTKACASAADCPAPSSGCNGMGYCKPD